MKWELSGHPQRAALPLQLLFQTTSLTGNSAHLPWCRQDHQTVFHSPNETRFWWSISQVSFKGPSWPRGTNRWEDGLMGTSRSQEVGWEALCCLGWAGFRCLGKYESKASLVGKSEEDLLQQPQGWGWISAVGQRAVSQGHSEMSEGDPKGPGWSTLPGVGGLSCRWGCESKPSRQEMHAWLLIRAF